MIHHHWICCHHTRSDEYVLRIICETGSDRLTIAAVTYYGQVAERSIARDCKSLDESLRRFESFPAQIINLPLSMEAAKDSFDEEACKREIAQLRINLSIEKGSAWEHLKYSQEQAHLF